MEKSGEHYHIVICIKFQKLDERYLKNVGSQNWFLNKKENPSRTIEDFKLSK